MDIMHLADVGDVLVSTAREAQPAILLLVGWLGYLNAKRTYWNSMAPVIIPEQIDFKELTFTVSNIGRGPAHNIQFSNYSHLVDWSERLIEWRLEFRSPMSLSPNAQTKVEALGFEDGQPIKKPDMIFWLVFPSEKANSERTKKRRSVPISIEYENLEGVTYITTALIEQGGMKSTTVRRDYAYYKLWRYIRNSVHRRFIVLKWELKRRFSGSKDLGKAS